MGIYIKRKRVRDLDKREREVRSEEKVSTDLITVRKRTR